MINYNISDRINQEIKEIINSYNSYREDKLKGNIEILRAEPGIKYTLKTNLGLIFAIKLKSKWSLTKNN
jgi:hypothetical protein